MLPESFTPSLLRQLELFKIRSRRAFLGTRQGGHISPKRGHGIEFSDYRRYELGDNPRHIDWGVYARSDRLYVKTFQEEQELSVLVLLDSSASMFQPSLDKKWERACEIAIALGYVALMEQDMICVCAPGLLRTPFYYGARAIHHLSAEVLSVKPPAVGDFLVEAQRAINRVRFPGVAIFVSDFLMPSEHIGSIVTSLRAKNLDIAAIQVLGPHDIQPLSGNEDAIAVDSETGEQIELSLGPRQREEYALLLEKHNTQVQELLHSNGVRFVQVRSDAALADVVVQNLPMTGVLR